MDISQPCFFPLRTEYQQQKMTFLASHSQQYTGDSAVVTDWPYLQNVLSDSRTQMCPHKRPRSQSLIDPLMAYMFEPATQSFPR